MVFLPLFLPPLPPPLYPYSTPPPLPWPPQDPKKSYKAVRSEEGGGGGGGGGGGSNLEPLMALAQNGATMHTVLGPACIFLRKGFAENRQAVRKS